MTARKGESKVYRFFQLRQIFQNSCAFTARGIYRLDDNWQLETADIRKGIFLAGITLGMRRIKAMCFKKFPEQILIAKCFNCRIWIGWQTKLLRNISRCRGGRVRSVSYNEINLLLVSYVENSFLICSAYLIIFISMKLTGIIR